MLKDGMYKIKHHDQRPLEGTTMGTFEVKDGQICNLTDFAKEVLQEGPADRRAEFDIRRLSNGYVFVEYERPVAKPDRPVNGRTRSLVSST